MKKLFLPAAAAVALASGSVLAADMPVKAPPPAPFYNWTGCYLGLGGGYGTWSQDNTVVDSVTGVAVAALATASGRGWFGTVQAGCDYQLSKLVIGAFADYDFSSIKGQVQPPDLIIVGEEKLRSTWAAGGRLGWLPFDSLLTYVAAGYTQARFDRIDFTQITVFAPIAPSFSPARTYSGYFVGTGYEYALPWFSGLTWKTEYRFAEYRTERNPIFFSATGVPFGNSVDSHKWVQTVRSELVWRFGGGAVVARY